MTKSGNTSYPFQNHTLPLEERIKDLISRLTLQEKIELMCQYQAEIPRLSIKSYKHGTEGAHGVAWLGEATVFPQNTGLACTWNPKLMRQIGEVIGDEARIYYQRNPAIHGLTIWAPTVDMERDPRWGRTEEAYGEDPHLTGRLSTELVKGMQGDHPFYYKTVATLKHFYANNNEVDRGSASVSIDPRNKREYYLKAFEPAFREGRAGSMMTAYNGVNGIPCNLNDEVNRIVKGEWGMNGFVVGDAGDVLGTVMDHHYTHSYAEAVSGSVLAGIDSITDDQDISFQALRDALEQGLLMEADLDHALSNTFRVRFRLGEFDPEDVNPYSNMPASKLCAPEHAALSLTAARESIVLLKNDGILPFSKEAGSVAVIGPLSDEAFTDWYSGTPPYRITPLDGIIEKAGGQNVRSRTGLDRIRLRSKATGKFLGLSSGEVPYLTADRDHAKDAELFERNDWGWGNVTFRSRSTGKFVTESESGELMVTAEEARGWFVKEAFDLVPIGTGEEGHYMLKSWEGHPISVNDQGRLTARSEIMPGDGGFIVEVVHDGIDEAVNAAKSSDRAIIFVGNSPFINGKETIDRPDIVLPHAQQELIKAVYEANPNTVVVIVGSYPFAVNWEDEHVPAILFTSHAGQELGHAIADVLYGDYNPAGRLNMTWYKSVSDLPDLMDYDIIKGKRTYQYFDGEVLYPFGHGLSYSSYEYGALSVDQHTVSSEGLMTVSVDIRNTSSVAGDEVVQLYVRAESSRVPRPLKKLIGFERIHLSPGESKTVQFNLPDYDLAIWDVTRDRYCVESGTYTLMAGPSSGVLRSEISLQVEGETIPPRLLSSPVRASNYDDYQGVYLDECREGGESIALKGSKGWISFHDCEFGGCDDRFEARVSGGTKGGEIVITVDHEDGPTVVNCQVRATGGRQAWTTVSAPVEGLTGRHNVYVTITGEVEISWFQIK